MHVTPDFIVTERDGELIVSLVGERDLPPLRLSPTYLALLEQHKGHGILRARAVRQ